MYKKRKRHSDGILETPIKNNLKKLIVQRGNVGDFGELITTAGIKLIRRLAKDMGNVTLLDFPNERI